MYSRTARFALTLCIVVPIIGIGAVLLYVHSLTVPASTSIVEAAPSTVLESDDVVAAETPIDSIEAGPDVNPLQPIGPKASTRVTIPSSGSCSSGSCSTPSAPSSRCSGVSSCD